MIRTRWLSAESKISLRALAARMRTSAFTDEGQSGFLLDRTREDRIEGRYIEKLTFQETVPDPFGQELVFDRVAYRQVQFTMYREFPQLELRDAPRGPLSFMSKLLELCDFNLISAPFTVDVMVWAEAIGRAVGAALVIDMMQLSQISVAPTVTGTMVLKSDRDVRSSLRSIVGSRSYTVEKVRLNWNERAHSVVIHLGNNGSAKVDPADVDLLSALRLTLPKTSAV
jgi:hypothetical protein